MISIAKQIELIHGLVDTRDLNDWESDFVISIYSQYLESSMDTTKLSSKQVDIIDKIYNKHFAG